MDAALNYLLKQIKEELHDTNKMLLRIAKALEEKNSKECTQEDVCEGKNEAAV